MAKFVSCAKQRDFEVDASLYFRLQLVGQCPHLVNNVFANGYSMTIYGRTYYSDKFSLVSHDGYN
jgi:hypothetical protein